MITQRQRLVGRGELGGGVAAIGAGIGIAVAGVLTVVGSLSVWPVVWASAAVVVWRAAPWTGWLKALIVVTVGASMALYIGASLAAATGIGVRASVVGLCLLGVSLVLWRVAPGAAPTIPLSRLALVCAVPGAWVLAAWAGALNNGGWARDWALRGDSSNNVLFARDVLTAGGSAWNGDNPVPLPHILISMGMLGDGRQAPDAEISAYVLVWHAIVIACLVGAGLVGNVTAVQAGVRDRFAIAVATVLPPLFVSSWAVTGHAMSFGFFNSHVGVGLCLLSLIVGIAPWRPVWGVALQASLAILLIATWTPLAALPGALGIVTLVRLGTERPSRTEATVLAAVLVSAAAVAGARVLVLGSDASAAFSSQGGVLAPSARTVAVILAALILTAAIAIVTRRARLGRWGLGVAGGLGLGIAFTLLLSRGHWTYYPMKMSWFAGSLACVALAAVGVPLIHHLFSRWSAPTLAVLTSLVIAAVAGPAIYHGESGRPAWLVDPVATIAGGGGGDQLATLLGQSRREAGGVVILWGTGSSIETGHNFWVVNLASGDYVSEADAERRLAIRTVAYALLGPDVTQLCTAERLLPGEVTVLSGEPGLEETLAQVCGADAPRVLSLADATPAMRERVQSTQ